MSKISKVVKNSFIALAGVGMIGVCCWGDLNRYICDTFIVDNTKELKRKIIKDQEDAYIE